MKIGETLISDIPADNQHLFITNDYFTQYMHLPNILYIQCILQDEIMLNHLGKYEQLFNLKNSIQKFKSQLICLNELKISINNYDKFIPKQIVDDYVNENFQAFRYIYETFEMPRDYDNLKDAYICSQYIAGNILKYNGRSVRVRYAPFTPFGRYGLKNESFNILSLDKSLRINLLPESNEFDFYEFDFNAFEIRTLLTILKIKQPSEDLYDLLHRSCPDGTSRQQFKKDLIVSLYSAKEMQSVLRPILISGKFYERYPIINEHVVNIFGKRMRTDRYHLLSRVLQSSAAYILFMQMMKVIKFITENNLKSKLSFSVHDSICISVHHDEKHFLNDFKNIITNVEIQCINYKDIMPVKIKTGKNYGKLFEIET